jgi:hypothetical protein
MEKQTSRGKTSPKPVKARKGAELIDGVEAKQLPPKILKTSQARLNPLFRDLARLYRHCSKRISSSTH